MVGFTDPTGLDIINHILLDTLCICRVGKTDHPIKRILNLIVVLLRGKLTDLVL